MYINVHTHHPSNSKEVFSIQNRYPMDSDFTMPFSVGIHPWFLNEKTVENELFQVEKLLQHPNCLAVGECGLDKAINSSFDFQMETFKKQILISEKYHKPLIIHCVRAFQEMIELKKTYKPLQPWIVHGFKKDKQLAFSLIKNGFYLSFGDVVLNNIKIQALISEIPFEKILLETDNSAIAIDEIYNKVAIIKKITLEKLLEKIHVNFKNIFF